jgi:hypothetical protein
MPKLCFFKKIYSNLPHRIEKLFFHDFAIRHCVQRGFVHGEAFVVWFEGDVVSEANDEFIAVRPRAFGFGVVDDVVIDPPRTFSQYGCHALGRRCVFRSS